MTKKVQVNIHTKYCNIFAKLVLFREENRILAHFQGIPSMVTNLYPCIHCVKITTF